MRVLHQTFSAYQRDQICTELGLTLEEVAQANLEKLFSRLERGQIHGEGDHR